MSENLRPCPFCGDLAKYDQIGGYPFVHRIKCVNELCEVKPESTSSVLQICENNWNIRPLEDCLKSRIDELRAENERLREALKLLASNLPSKDSLPHSTRTKYHELHDVVEKALAPQIEEK